MQRRARQSGFTLLETIVTLVVVSLIVTVLMQALQQSLSLRTRLLRHERATRMAGLQEQWFRDTVSGAIADLPDGFGRMSGTEQSMELVTPSPLGGGGMVRVHWTLEPVADGYALDYDEPGSEPVDVIRGPLHDATFAYMDGAGEWQPDWKPDDDSLEVLPRMVRLQATTASGELLWLVPVFTAPWKPVNLRPEEQFGL